MEAAASFLQIKVSYRGKAYNLRNAGSDTLGALAKQLEELTGASSETIKFIMPKGKQPSARKSTPSALQPLSAQWRSSTLLEAGFFQGMNILMSGASTEEVEAVSKPSAAGIADFDYEEKRARMRAHRKKMHLALPTGPYVFADFRTWELPGIVLHPPNSKALKLMHRLASDPGVVAIMNKYKWRVGIMTELAPEGYVGVSPVCLLGFNRNRGMEISLRLRTDDLAGFRKYNSIRQTLLHELTHMVHDEHDEHFKALNSLLNREAEALDWTRKKAHTLGGKAAADSEEESESGDDEEVGRVLGTGGANAPVLDPRQAAAAAAMRRDAEKRRREAEGRSTADVADDVIMDGFGGSPGRSGRSVEVGVMQDAEKESPMEDGEGNIDIGRKVAVERGREGDGNREREEAGTLTGEQKFDEGMGVDDGDKTEGTGLVNERLPGVKEGALERRSTAASSEPDPDDSLGPTQRATEPHENESMRSEPDETLSRPDGGQKVVEAEFEQRQTGMEDMHVDSDSGAALEGPQGTTESSNQEMPSGSDAGATGGDAEWQRAQEAAAEASGRIQKAVADLKQQAGPGEVMLTLRTLATILHNVMEHPSEPKYRRVRKTNAAFFERVGRFEAALEVLHTAGFREDTSGSDTMVLQRDDPGLLWLTCSLVEESLA